MVEVVAMVKPLAGVVREKFNFHALHIIHNHCVLQYPLIWVYVRIYYLEKMAMKVHWMWHHAVIPISNSDTLSFIYNERFSIGIDLAVDGPVW